MEFNKHNFFIRFLWLLIFIPLIGFSSNLENKKEIYVVFRFDDYSANSNTDLEVKIIDAFKEHDIPFTIGVIPFVCADDKFVTTKQELLPLSKYKIEILKKASDLGVIEIALHGYSHQTINENEIRSEFSGLEYEQQMDKIHKGKSFLEKETRTSINSFIPPWNSYDYNTLKIIKKYGFSNISADRFGVLQIPSSINFYPSTCDILQVKEAVRSAKICDKEPTIIIALFHEYDFREAKPIDGTLEVDDLINLLFWIKTQENIKVLTINELSNKISNIQLDNKYLLNDKTIAISRYIPPVFTPGNNFTYASKSFYKTMLLRYILYYSCILLISSLITIILSKFILKKYSYLFKFFKYALLFLFLSMIMIIFVKSNNGYYIISLLVLIFGSNFGIWIAIYFNRSKVNSKPTI